MLIEVYLLRCQADGLLAYRRETTLLGPGEAPDTAAGRAGSRTDGEPGEPLAVLHSTSWRYRGDGSIVLTYAGFPDPQPARPAVPIEGHDIARGDDPLSPTPPRVRNEEVAVHAARHLAFIVRTDPTVRLALERLPELARALAPLAPRPAGQLTP